MIYFFDNCISYRLSDMLRALGEDAESQRQSYPQDIADVDLFSQLAGRPGLVFISTDEKQKTRAEEARALKQSGISALYFGPFFRRKRFWEQAVWLMRRWERIRGFAEGAAPGTFAEIKENGRAWTFQL